MLKRVAIVLMVLAAFGVYAAANGEGDLQRWYCLRAELSQAQTRIAEGERALDQRRADAAQLQRNPAAAIREDLELGYPGETIVRAAAPEQPAQNAPARSAAPRC